MGSLHRPVKVRRYAELCSSQLRFVPSAFARHRGTSLALSAGTNLHLALLVPTLLPALVDVPYVDTYVAPTESAVHFAESNAGKCAPSVRVYAARSAVRPVAYAVCNARPSPAGAPLDKHGRPLQGAARKARLAHAGATYCRTTIGGGK